MDWKFGETKDIDDEMYYYGEPDEGGYPIMKTKVLYRC